MAEEPKVRTAFTKDERGILNNWAIEPKMYFDDKAEKNSDNQVNKQVGKMPNGRLAMMGIALLVLSMIGITLIAIT